MSNPRFIRVCTTGPGKPEETPMAEAQALQELQDCYGRIKGLKFFVNLVTDPVRLMCVPVTGPYAVTYREEPEGPVPGSPEWLENFSKQFVDETRDGLCRAAAALRKRSSGGW